MASKKMDKVKITYSNTAIVSKKVKSYENDPFFVKKNEEARAFLQKAGVPSFLDKRTS
jgi:hypothetical protein